jgi:hypothetical protein
MLTRNNSLAVTLCASTLLGSMTLPLMYANACTRVVGALLPMLDGF